MINENEKLKSIQNKIYDYIEHIVFAVVNNRLNSDDALEMIKSYIDENILISNKEEYNKYVKFFKDALTMYQFENTNAQQANLNEDQYDDYHYDENDFRNTNVDRDDYVVETKKNDETEESVDNVIETNESADDVHQLVIKKAASLAYGIQYLFQLILAENHPPYVVTNWVGEEKEK